MVVGQHHQAAFIAKRIAFAHDFHGSGGILCENAGVIFSGPEKIQYPLPGSLHQSGGFLGSRVGGMRIAQNIGEEKFLVFQNKGFRIQITTCKIEVGLALLI